MNNTTSIAEIIGVNETESNATTSITAADHQTITLILGIQSIVGTIWWLFIMLVTIKNETGDANLKLLSGEEVVPISWIWERMGEQGGIYNYLAFSLCFTFLLYFIVSVVEMVAWVLYVVGEKDLMRLYFSTVGYWGSIVGYAVPWILAIVHLCT